MEEIGSILQYGVLAFATIAIFYSFKVLQTEQSRDSSPREGILLFSSTLLKYSVALTVILGGVQIYEKSIPSVISSEQVMEKDKNIPKNLQWSSSPEFHQDLPMSLTEDGMIDFEKISFTDEASEYSRHRRKIQSEINGVISLCAQNLVVAKPFISTATPATASQLLIIDGRLLTRPVKIQIEKNIGVENGLLGEMPKYTEYTTFKIHPNHVESISIEKATRIDVVPVACL